MNKIFNISSICLGMSLLALNLYGLLFGTYNQPVKENWPMGVTDRQVDRPSVSDLNIKPGESDGDYFHRLTNTVNNYIIHGDSKNVAIWDNYFIWIYDSIWPHDRYFLETYDIDRAFDKGVGLCSQHSIIIMESLKKNGFATNIVGLSGHVVTSAKSSNGKEYILDGDYGIVMPHSLREIESLPELTNEYYLPKYTTIPNKRIHLPMVELYGSADDNRYVEISEEGWKLYYYEQITDYLKWILPFLLIFIPIYLRKRKN